MQSGVVTRGEWVLGQPDRVEAPKDARRGRSLAAVSLRDRVAFATAIVLTGLGVAALAAFSWAASLGYTPLF